ncbi:7532_t:CDS:2, partial [Dentiscutata heterogama]
MIDNKNFQQYYFYIRAIRPELTTIVKKEASLLFEYLFPNEDIKKFRIQLIDWNNQAYSFDYDVPELAIFAVKIISILPTSAKSERNNLHHIVYNKENRLDQIIQVNTANSNKASLENTVPNVEFDDMENNDDNLEEQSEENIMQTIENIDNFNTNDQIVYNEAVIKSSVQATHSIQEKTLENCIK